jgi:hypothetical protein
MMVCFKKSFHSYLLLVVLLMTFGTVAFAQSNYGAVRGIVADVQGAGIPGATVVLTSDTTKISRTTVSNGSGEYAFSAVQPGTYSVTVTSDGFKRSEAKGITVDAGNTIGNDVALELGSTSQSIEVTAADPVVDNTTSYGGQMIDSQKLQNLPNPGRNPFLFSKLDNAVAPVGDPRFVRFQDQSGSSTISIAGAPASSNNYSVDGVPITDFNNRAVIIPSLESVEEVKIQSNTYDAEIGRTSGGMFNTTLKSGSSALHGVLMGETRQTNWGANTFFNNRNNTPRGAAEFYSYVGSLSGPIPLPRWLGGKDKTFFSITEEGYRQRSPFVNSTSFAVPTNLQRTGDFSEIGTVSPDGKTCLSGTCIKNLAAGGTSYYPGNKITNINPIGLQLIQAYPTPNTSITALGQPNFNGGDTLGDRADEFIGKVTHQFFNWWMADFYYMHYGSKEPGGNPLQTAASYSGSYLLYRKVDATGIQNTITLNPTTVLTVGFGFNRFPNDTQDISSGFDQSTLGFPSYYTSAMSKKAFPRIVTDGSCPNGTTLVCEGTSNSGPAVFFSRNFVAGVAKSWGKHNFKVGYNYRSISVTFTSLSDTSGTFTFNALSGAAAADILQGYPTTGSIIVPSKLAYNTPYQAVYFQDDYRMTPRLTLNLGFRYEHENGIHERNNQISVGFDRTATYNAYNSGIQATGGVMFAGQNGYGTNTGNMGSEYNPRAGFAYALDSSTVLKGGYGVFYIPQVYSNSNSYAPGYNLTNSIPTQTATNAPISLSNPYPSLQTTPTGNANGLATSIGSTLSLIDQYRRSPLFQSYSLAMEHEFPLGFALKIGYIGGHGRNLTNSRNINQLADDRYALGSALSTAVTNPYAGVGGWGRGTVARYQTLLPFPQYQGITLAQSTGVSDYNGLAVKVQKRFNRGLTILASYTWSSNWDNLWGASSTLNSGNNGPQDSYNLAPEYSRAINDIPNRFTVSGTYELPFGRGKMFLGGVNRWMDLVVGGWRFNDVMIMQNGAPLAITQTNANTAFGNSAQRPSLIAGMNPCKSGRPEDRLQSYFNANAYSISPQYSYGSAARTSSCYGPGYINSDFSLNKDFHVTERVHAEFRAEALNAFNTPQFSTPTLSVGGGTTRNASAGQITGTLGFPRLVQLGARLYF